jgi:ribosomal protein L11 methyltransferase
VAAADYDQLGVDATIDNAAVNGVEIEVSKLDLRTEPIPHSDILVANILASVLVVLASKMGSQRPAKVVLSGILDEQADSVLEVWQQLGYSQADRRSREGWTALLLARNSG